MQRNKDIIQDKSKKILNIEEHQVHLPVMQHMSADTIFKMTDEDIKELERSVNGGGNAFAHYLIAKNVIFNYDEIGSSDISDTVLSIKNFYDYNSVATMNALCYVMYEISQKFSANEVFLILDYQIELDSQNRPKVKKANIEINHERMAYYLLQTHFKDKFFLSEKRAEDKKNKFYVYSQKEYKWTKTGASSFSNETVSKTYKMFTRLGMNTKEAIAESRLVAKCFELEISMVNDLEEDMLENYSKKNPSLIQFRDVVYDMDKHAVTRMNHDFRLAHFHDLDLPLGTLSKEDIPSDGTFIDLPVSLEETMQQADLFIRRLKIIVKEDQTDFFMSVIGNLFYSNGQRFQVTTALVGGGGLGKSHFWNAVKDYVLTGYNASINQDDFSKNSNFILSQLVGKKMNLIGELKDSTLPKSIIHLVKSVSSGDPAQVEFKNQDAYNTTLYAKSIMLANAGQLPPIRTSDANDDGFKRRFVVVECNEKRKTDEWKKEFTNEKLKEAAPHFTLACIMTLMKHVNNGNIGKFHNDGGCSEKVIKGFTTKDMVERTRRYFSENDRLKMFFCELPILFKNEITMNEYRHLQYDLDGFRTWLSTATSSRFNELFKEWHNENFTAKKGSNVLKETLKTNYSIEEKVKRIDKKVKRVYGDEFSDLVESVILEVNPETLKLLM